MRSSVVFVLCVAAAAACLPTPAARAEIGNCHSFTYWQLTGEEQVDVSFGKLEAKLKQMLYRPYPWRDGLVMASGDVITFGDAHSGFVYAPGTFANLRKTMQQRVLADGSLLAKSAFTVAIRTSALWTYPDDYLRSLQSQGASEAAIRAKLRADPPSIGFFSTAETVESLRRRIPSYASMPVTVWKQPEELEVYPESASINIDQTAYFQLYLIYPERPELIEAERVTRIIWLPGFASGGTVDGRTAGVGRHELTASSIEIARPWGLESELTRDSYKGKLFHRLEVTAALEVIDTAAGGGSSAGGNRCQLVTGTWRWFNHVDVTLGKGTASSTKGDSGTWTCVDSRAGTIELSWNGGVWIDTLTLSADGKSLSGTNQHGGSVGASR